MYLTYHIAAEKHLNDKNSMFWLSGPFEYILKPERSIIFFHMSIDKKVFVKLLEQNKI